MHTSSPLESGFRVDPSRWPVRRVLLGCVVLFVAGALAAWVASDKTPVTNSGSTTVVLQYQPKRKAETVPVYADLLRQTDSQTKFLVAVSSDEDEQDLRDGLGTELGRDPRLEFVHVSQPLGPWVRDRYIPFGKDGRAHLYVPPTEAVPPPERGSLEVATALLERDPSMVRVRGRLRLVGGDVILTSRDLLIGAGTVHKHTRGMRARRVQLEKALRTVFGRTPLVVGTGRTPLPYDHIDMFLSAVDDRTLLLGDPRLAVRTLAGDGLPPAVLLDGAFGRFLTATQEAMQDRYDAVLGQLRSWGFRVVRVPILHGEPLPDGRRGTILTWNNALVDRALRRVFVPHYGLPRLDALATETWRDLGYDVRPIDSRGAIVRGGAVRCLTTVLPGPDTKNRRRTSRPD